MFGKSIFKKIVEDFSSVKNYGFYYLQDIDDQVGSSVLFKNDRYFLEIGYDFGQHKMFVILYDSSRKRCFNTDEGRAWAEKENPQENWGICQFTELMNGIALIGRSYKEQVVQVKPIVLEFLKKLD
jgi:hypothetical protein